MADWKTLSTHIAYENPWMFVREDKAINPAGREVIYGVVESKSDSVYVVPVDGDGNTYITLQHRYTIDQDSWECVAGRTDGQPIDQAAKRELLEETGLSADVIIPIGTVQVANGIATFKGTFCIARGIKRVTDQLDAEDGILGTQKLSFADVQEKILAGEITCAQSIAAFLMARAYLEKEAA
jgi:8-oxo-dGTP pyrophosphatase MutT (NUDIX family)